MKNESAIPVLMYHSVGRMIPDWDWSFLTVPVGIFTDQLSWLAKAGYQTANLTELFDHVSGRKKLDRRTVVITFDDGYLDNWTYAQPLLKRFGFEATVFVNPDFVEPGNAVRPTLDNVWNGDLSENKLDVRGFMSWRELKLASDQGTLSVQSHAMTHTWYPVSDEVLDFHHPGDAYYWVDWNAYPATKPSYLKNPTKSRVLWGVPIYAHGKALETRRYFPHEAESAHLAAFVRNNSGNAFFKSERWKEMLFGELKAFRSTHSNNGRLETPAERQERVLFELNESKRIIADQLNCAVDHFAWPGGGYDDYAMAEALRHYRSVTLSSRDRSDLKNRSGEDAGKIKRIGAPYVEFGGRVLYTGGRYLINYLEEFKGNRISRKRRQMLKALYLFLEIYKTRLSLKKGDHS